MAASCSYDTSANASPTNKEHLLTDLLDEIQNTLEEGLHTYCEEDPLGLKRHDISRSSLGYSLDIDYLASLTDKRINEDVEKCRKEQSQVKNNRTVPERWLCSFLVWGGTRNHPSSKRYVEEGIIIGDFFHRADGSRKKVSANGFQRIKRLDETEDESI